ncbi:hypothetical protein DL764_001799 [Monosporascus ibericus]|uniref:Uncharacterized protein n=1 Tax=Monosporascus ibericus TaxID=155417 RepID=A0A4Q4TN74_9PEZI|nr:hypothetical protein DL764_001799 [Monosporascus ibericus]
MLPPVDVAVLKNNPDFERVYKKVTGVLLNPDGSTRNDVLAKKREAVREELREHRLKATRRHLLRHALRTAIPLPESSTSQPSQARQPPQAATAASSRPRRGTRTGFASTSQQQPAPSLPPELIDILLLLPPLLDQAPSLPASSLTTLLTTPPLSNLPTHFRTLLAHLSAHLNSQALALARVLHPQTNTSYLHRSIPSLPSTTRTLIAHLHSTQTGASQARLAATADLKAHLDRHGALLAAQLRVLEAKHGPAARGTALRAELAALDAGGWALAARALRSDAMADVYPREARAALLNYRRHLAGARVRLLDGVGVREAELRDYGVSVSAGGDGDDDGGRKGGRKMAMATATGEKEKTMREIARVYKEMEGRVREVRADLERLGMS